MVMLLYTTEKYLLDAPADSKDGPQEVGTLEAIKVKILILGEDGNPNSLRIAVVNENDLFFHYMHVIDERVSYGTGRTKAYG